MMKTLTSAARIASPVGPYSPGLVTNGLVFVSLQGPVVPENGRLVGPGMQEQTRQALGNVRAILEAPFPTRTTFGGALAIDGMLIELDAIALTRKSKGRVKPHRLACVVGWGLLSLRTPLA